MSKAKRSIIIIGILFSLIIGISTNTFAATNTTWTDPETGYVFNINIDDNGNGTVTSSEVIQKDDLEKFQEAKKRAQEKAVEIAKENDGTTNEEKQEERSQTTKTETEKININAPSGSSIKTKGDLANGSSVICAQRQNLNIAEPIGQDYITVAGQRVQLSNLPEEVRLGGSFSTTRPLGNGNGITVGTITALPVSNKAANGMVTDDTVYTKKLTATVGTTYETARAAYIYSKVKDAKDNPVGILEDNLQKATWLDDYFKDTLNGGEPSAKYTSYYKDTGGLFEEAEAYAQYREAVEKFKASNAGKTVVDTINNRTVSTNLKDNEQILGSYTLDYVRGYSKISGREFQEFGGLSAIKLYTQDNQVLPDDAWEIRFKEGRTIDEADKAYQEKFPKSGEEFYIVLHTDKLPSNTTKIKNIEYLYKESNMEADVDGYSGYTYNAEQWNKIAKLKGTRTISRGVGRPPLVIYDYEYYATPRLKKVDAQNIAIIKDVRIKENIHTVNVPSSIPTFRLWIPPSWIDWPNWPDYPDYPDYPETDLTFTIAGIVWEDTKAGKESNFDGLIGTANSGAPEKGMANVEVKLYEYGTSNVIKSTYTDANGAYIFNEVPTGRYDVGFIYDGLTYRTTKAFASGSKSDYLSNPGDEKYKLDSKAEESPVERQNFNNKFYEITAQGAKNETGLITNIEPLEYKTENGVSKIQTTYRDGKVKKDFQLETRTSTTLSVGFPFDDYVNNANTYKVINGQKYYENYTYMAYVNLGLQKREEVDFALMKDVYTSTVTINGKEINYKYNSRAARENISEAFDIGVKKVASYADVKYNREVYKSDFSYRIEDYKANTLNPVSGATLRGMKEEDQELKVFITYKMRLRNQSEIYSGTINQLVDYYDATYDLIMGDVKLDIRHDDGTIEKNKVVARAPYYVTQHGAEGSLIVTVPEKHDSEYNKTYISGVGNLILQTGEYVDLYLTFEVDKDSTRAVKLGEKSNEVEITSYSTFDQGAITKSKTMGMIDRDSAPGNLDPTNSNTLEDDSDIAPTINIKLYEEVTRTMNGVVWEDERTNTLATGQQVGDGLRQATEKKLNGVLVQLIELITAEDGSKYEYIWQEMYTGESGYKYVNIDGNIYDSKLGTVQGGTTEVERGEYRFSGYIPGDYIVRFIYGKDEKTLLTAKNDTSYNGQDYKSTAYWQGNNVNVEWYDLKSTYLNNTLLSDAKDNEARRLQVINYSKVMKNSIAQVLASHEQNTENYNVALHKELMNNTYMYADTAKMKVEVEYATTATSGTDDINSYNIRDIDFGIEERPTASIALNKEIVAIKITLADGTTLIDTEAGIKKNVQFAPSAISIYMDDEVMQGANIQIKYKVTVKNNSQIDYTGATANSVGTTYYTGKVSTTDRRVTTSVDIVADYVDNSLVYRVDDNQGYGWASMEQTRLASIEQMENEGYLDRDVKLAEKDIHQILINESLASIQLAPGESKTLDLLLTKTISSADDTDDLSYDNIAEILQYTNLVGRRADLPGNQDPTKPIIEVDADRTETIVILPPFGANKAVASYMAIAISVLAVIAGGVIVVKKKLMNR